MIAVEQMAREVLDVYTEHYPFLKGRVIIKLGSGAKEMYFERGRAIKIEPPVIRILVYMPLKVYKINIDFVCDSSDYFTHCKIERAFLELIRAISNDAEAVYLGDVK